MEDNKSRDVEEKRTESGFITKASAYYYDRFALRAAIQAIPGLGSSLDTMMAGLGAKWQYSRLEDFISALNKRLSRLDQLGKLPSIEPSESLFDFMIQTFDQVIRTRSEEKRKRFANLVTNQFVNKLDWDEAETACRLIGELSDIHIEILDIAISAPSYKDVFDGRGVITFQDKSSIDKLFRYKDKVVYLQDALPNLNEMYIRMICIELLSKSLLEGLTYIDTIGEGFYSASNLAKWFLDWISEPEEKTKNKEKTNR